MIASSGDAFFAGVAAWAVALLVLAMGRGGRRGDALALAGGLLSGAAIFLSYGLVLVVAIPATVAYARRRARHFSSPRRGRSPQSATSVH